jgi:hypothetical protein
MTWSTSPIPSTTVSMTEESVIAGVAVDPSLAAPRTSRPRVALVAPQWGENSGERAGAIRLVAGALALHADVVIVNLTDLTPRDAAPPAFAYDGILPVHSVHSRFSPSGVVGILEAALWKAEGGRAIRNELSETAARELLRMEWRPSVEAVSLLGELEPDVVVLAGVETLWLVVHLPVGPTRPRIVVLPLMGSDWRAGSAAFTWLAEFTSAVCASSDAETRNLMTSFGSRNPAMVHRLRFTFPVNPEAARAGLAGMSAFDPYVLVISGTSEDDAATVGKAPPHDYLRAVVGDVSVAEVLPDGCVVSAFSRRFEIPWSMSRMNLWRLMGGAVAMLDVRRQGPVGRETLESMAFGTPVVVPAGSVAAEHARVSNGGLWYGAPGEMLDCLRVFVDDGEMRDRFGACGRTFVEREHSDTERFVREVRNVVVG